MSRFTHKHAVVMSLFCLCALLALNGPIVQMAKEAVTGEFDNGGSAIQLRASAARADSDAHRGVDRTDPCTDETGAVGTIVRRVGRVLLDTQRHRAVMCEGLYLLLMDAVLSEVYHDAPRSILDQAPDIVVRAVRSWARQNPRLEEGGTTESHPLPNQSSSTHTSNNRSKSSIKQSVIAVHGRSWLEYVCTVSSHTNISSLLLRQLLLRASSWRLSARQMATFVGALKCLTERMWPSPNPSGGTTATAPGGGERNSTADAPSCLRSVWGHFAVCAANTFIWRLSAIGGKTRNNGVLYLAAGFRGLVYQVRKGTSFRKGWYPQHVVREAAQQHATNFTVMFLTYHDEDVYFLTRYRRDEREHLHQLLRDYKFLFLLHYSPSMVMPFGVGASFLGSRDPFACGTLLRRAPRGRNNSENATSSSFATSDPRFTVNPGAVVDNPKKWYTLFPRMVPVPHSLSQEPDLERLFKAAATSEKKKRLRRHGAPQQGRDDAESYRRAVPKTTTADSVLLRYEHRDAKVVWRGATTGKYPAPYALTDRCRMVRAFVDAQSSWARRNMRMQQHRLLPDARGPQKSSSSSDENGRDTNRTFVVRHLNASAEFWADVAFSGFCQGVSRKHIPSPLRKSMNLSQLVRFQVHLDVDGNTNSWEGLRWRLRTGMAVVKVQSSLGFTQWYYPSLINETHLLVVNVERVVAAALLVLDNETLGAKLAAEADRFASQHLTKAALDAAVHHAVKNVWWIGNDRDRKWNIRSR